MTTQGSTDDFRYLLPRLFQGVAEERYSYDPEILSCNPQMASTAGHSGAHCKGSSFVGERWI
jgi:hypothetical protein